jgi:sigma-B regulation protein RsbU (phosphoserine phosphatase)
MEDYSKKLRACQKRTKRLSTCLEVGFLLSTELALANLLDKIMATAKETMNCDACNLMLFDKDTNELVSLVAMGKVGKKLKELLRIKVGEGIAGWVAETGTAALIDNVYEHPKFCPDYDKKSGYRTRNMICAPLISKGKIVGIAQVINKKNKRKFTGDDLELFTLICSHAAVAIENAKLHENLLEKERIEKDLEFARSVQKSFLPYKPPDIKKYSFSFKYIPAQMVGGDFFDFIVTSNKKVGLIIGDVSGKGVSAAMFMARVMSDLRYLTLLEPDPKIVLERFLFRKEKAGCICHAPFHNPRHRLTHCYHFQCRTSTPHPGQKEKSYR